jgi:hypothetical protein
MGTSAAPRIDDRLVAALTKAPLNSTPAELTRQLGALAWDLGLPRPSYEQVRVLARSLRPSTPRTQTSPGRILLRVIDELYTWPAPFMDRSRFSSRRTRL